MHNDIVVVGRFVDVDTGLIEVADYVVKDLHAVRGFDLDPITGPSHVRICHLCRAGGIEPDVIPLDQRVVRAKDKDVISVIA